MIETPTKEMVAGYKSGKYWSKRSDLIYYKYVDYMIRVLARDSNSLIDVGTGNCPYLEWWNWINVRKSIDIVAPYSSGEVEGITANILDHKFETIYDVCTCLQVLEHIPEPGPFAKRLFEVGKTVVISVPYGWPKGKTKGHVQDPVTEDKLKEWTGREPTYSCVATEPFKKTHDQRLISVYLRDDTPDWKQKIENRIVREIGVIDTSQIA